jgi:hypothetical protein
VSEQQFTMFVNSLLFAEHFQHLPRILHLISEEKDRRNTSQNCPKTTLIQCIKNINEQKKPLPLISHIILFPLGYLNLPDNLLLLEASVHKGAQMTETQISSNRFQTHCIPGCEECKSSDIIEYMWPNNSCDAHGGPVICKNSRKALVRLKQLMNDLRMWYSKAALEMG